MIVEALVDYNSRITTEHSDEIEENQYKCKVLQLILNRSLQTFAAILSLLQNGFADQAYMLFRSLYENWIIGTFISQSNEKTARLFYQEQNTISKSTKDDYSWARLSGKFTPKESVNFNAISSKCAIDNSYLEIWRVQYRVACKLLHTSPQGTCNTFSQPPTQKEWAIVGATPHGLNLSAEHSAIMLENIARNYFLLFQDQSNIVFLLVLHKWVDEIRKSYTEVSQLIFDNNLESNRC